MSIDWYAYCPIHNVKVFVTDNKGNPPDRDDIIKFLGEHSGCGGDSRVSILEFFNEWDYRTERFPKHCHAGEKNDDPYMAYEESKMSRSQETMLITFRRGELTALIEGKDITHKLNAFQFVSLLPLGISLDKIDNLITDEGITARLEGDIKVAVNFGGTK